MSDHNRSRAWGTLFAFASFVMWGLLPLYWKQVQSASAMEILAHRIVWSTIVLIPVVALFQRRELRAALTDVRALATAAAAGVLLGGNWFIYVFAVTSNRVLEASLGYYINPLVNVCLGIVVLRERLNRAQLVALLLAAAGVLVMTVSYGRVPWTSLGLAFSFGIYGLVKKTGRLNTVMSLLVELAVITPAALIYLVVAVRRGAVAFGGDSLGVTLLLAGAGVVTVAPLLLFGAGARRIPLARVGFLQYAAPTLMLVIGAVVYGEPFTVVHVVSFAAIWVALLIYSISLVHTARLSRGRR